MARVWRRALALAAVAGASPALADERDYCPARPGLGTPACTIAPGRLSVETGLVDWTRDDTPDSRTDGFTIGDTLVRVGVTDRIELQAEWVPYGSQRVRDRASGAVTRTDGVGDLTLGFKANLKNPDGSGFSIAVQPFVSAPIGRSPAGAGDWGAGVLVPMSWDLGHDLSLQVTPEIDAAVNESGRGRHLAYSAIVGLGFPITGKLSGTVEYQALRDDDPGGATTQHLASASIGWMPTGDWQVDVGAVIGLNRSSTDAELYVGLSRRF
ncbi:MAG: transporter [Sphingomonas sp.]|uniref:transporter n=1 Tax=Sphingomonas sp. TaxID=28214 RepID=UPI0025FB5B2E|nr:transporter [Sphingomonas sp.]MBX9860172.1 transporter [Sphingomonas sp.]MBY0283814.1 transporter [Sphingomonas sp.]